uniref:Uncharacterized protein n=1 Tax=Arundo donax TaxID=35708 RepID=A0A0A9CRD3_ARUDO
MLSSLQLEALSFSLLFMVTQCYFCHSYKSFKLAFPFQGNL